MITFNGNFLEEFAGTEGAEALAAMAVVFGVVCLIAGGIGLVLYILRAIGVYQMAKKADISNPWLAFIPIVNVLPYGKLAEKTVKRDGTKSAKFGVILLILKMAIFVVAIVAAVAGILVSFRLFVSLIENTINESDLLNELVTAVIWVVPLSVILSGLGIAYTILHYVALYRVFTAFHYEYASMYTALSVVGMLFLSDILEPVFLFVVRNREPVFDYRDRLNLFTQNL